MTIVRLDESDLDAWTSYVRSHPEATLYHRVEWKGLIERNFGHQSIYLTAVKEGKISGILPLIFMKSRLFGTVLCSMPFLNYGGIVADDAGSAEALLEEASSLVRSLNADYLELRHLNRTDHSMPVKLHKVSMMVELDADPKVIWNSYKSEHRRLIRKAMKSGLEYAVGRHELLDEFYDVLSRGWKVLGTPIYSKRFFSDVLDTFGEAVEISVVYFDRRPIATAFDGFHGGTVEGMWAYALREYRKLEPNYFLYWTLIERACQQGLRTFHMGRSTAGSPAAMYKKKWNATARQLYWEYVLGRRRELPSLDVSNSKYRLPIAVWRKMPLRLTRWIGPYLARSIP